MIAIEGYDDIERIGQGGLGDVYRATRTTTGGVVAIKVLRDISDESVAWHRTRRELTALVSLTGHANVIQLFELLDLPEGPALVMEFAPGGSVADLMLRRDRPLSVGETVLVGRQTAAALVAAHAQGIVHRDVKPQNLLIDAYGQVKLCDFGIAAMARSEEFQARTSAISMRYASPEDLDDDVEVGPPSDVYSLGATMLHMARGAPPTLKDRLAPWQPPETDDTELAALDAVIASCLHPTAAERPDATHVVDELERLGWSIDERNRALAFESVDLSPGSDEHVDTTEVRAVASAPAAGGPVADMIAALDADAAPTVPRRPSVAGVDAAEGPHEDTDDDTVYRADRRPPDPLPPPRRRRWPLVVAAVVIVVVVVVVVVAVVWPGDGADEPGIVFVDRPGGLGAVTALEWPLGDVGECLVQDGVVLAPVECNEPHDLQRVAVGSLDAAEFPPDATFDEAAVRGAVRLACAAAFESFVGLPPADSELEAPFSAPSSATWAEDGDRTFQCMLGVADRRISGDAEAVAR